MRYIYPVISRRSGGVSIGINLNENNACNWACVYCQVPNLIRGGPPPVDLDVLADELSQLLGEVLDGDFLTRRVPKGLQTLTDIAFSGNGEPTSSDQFGAAVEIVISTLEHRGLAGQLPIRVITNGSLIQRASVGRALSRIGVCGGELWFKIDRATRGGMMAVNRTAISLARVEQNLEKAAKLLTTRVQTCWFGIHGAAPSDAEAQAYIELIARHRSSISGVSLYGIARPSMQPDGRHLSRLPAQELEALALRLAEIGVTATVSE